MSSVETVAARGEQTAVLIEAQGPGGHLELAGELGNRPGAFSLHVHLPMTFLNMTFGLHTSRYRKRQVTVRT